MDVVGPYASPALQIGRNSREAVEAALLKSVQSGRGGTRTVTLFSASVYPSACSLPGGLRVSQANRLNTELSYLWITDKGND